MGERGPTGRRRSPGEGGTTLPHSGSGVARLRKGQRPDRRRDAGRGGRRWGSSPRGGPGRCVLPAEADACLSDSALSLPRGARRGWDPQAPAPVIPRVPAGLSSYPAAGDPRTVAWQHRRDGSSVQCVLDAGTAAPARLDTERCRAPAGGPAPSSWPMVEGCRGRLCVGGEDRTGLAVSATRQGPAVARQAALWWDPYGGVAAWQCSGVAEWQSGGVAEWQSGRVAAWRRASVTVRQSGSVAAWRRTRETAGRAVGGRVGCGGCRGRRRKRSQGPPAGRHSHGRERRRRRGLLLPCGCAGAAWWLPRPPCIAPDGPGARGGRMAEGAWRLGRALARRPCVALDASGRPPPPPGRRRWWRPSRHDEFAPLGRKQRAAPSWPAGAARSRRPEGRGWPVRTRQAVASHFS